MQHAVSLPEEKEDTYKRRKERSLQRKEGSGSFVLNRTVALVFFVLFMACSHSRLVAH